MIATATIHGYASATVLVLAAANRYQKAGGVHFNFGT